MCDKLVFDLAQEVEGSPSVFVRKDWLNILDNQNQNYNNNQSIIDTSQLSNSNKYMSYREAYLSVPMLLTIGSTSFKGVASGGATTATGTAWNPTVVATGSNFVGGLKNWFGQIVHSLTLDYNGTTIVQQTPYVNMWNSFKLMTSLSITDVMSQGATIGFYPDDANAWGFYPPSTGTNTGVAPLASSGDCLGCGVLNNTNFIAPVSVVDAVQLTNTGNMMGNDGFFKRQLLINFDGASPLGAVGATSASSAAQAILSGVSQATNNSLISNSSLNLLWKSYISTKQAEVLTAGGAVATEQLTTCGMVQYSIVATIYLKHLHSFFNMCPLLKGVFMKLTLNLNNASSTILYVSSRDGTLGDVSPTTVQLASVSIPVGGVNPIMMASATQVPPLASNTKNGAVNLLPVCALGTTGGNITRTVVANLSVGATCLDTTLNSAPNFQKSGGALSKSVYLYIPSYSFNPVFEQAYLSNPVKQIKYTDIYQYQILNVASNGMINNLITNGIANIKSVLILPFLSTTNATFANIPNTKSGVTLSANTGIVSGVPVWQSPFDPAGTGPTSPLAHISNFNVQVSGQNAIYNMQKYAFEQFNNQLYGQNAVNGGLTDGLTSSLVDRQAFDQEYCYYYVNVERMLPVEMSVPKSIQVVGQNMSAKAMDYYVFVEYGVENLAIDALTGARV
jgi:hypothetical protein